MHSSMFRLGSACALAGLLAGCASMPRTQGVADVHALVSQRNSAAQQWATTSSSDADITASVDALVKQPLTPDTAVSIALLRNPRMQREFARLDIAAADVFDASRIANPTFSVAALHPNRAGDVTRIDSGLSASLADLLLLPAHQRLAQGEYKRSKELIAGAIVTLISDVRSAWFNDVAAQQVATMRDAVAKVAATSADLAVQFHTAGNIDELALKLQQAAASQARLSAIHAHAEALRARSTLNQLLGLSGAQAQWQTTEQLPAPLPDEDSIEALLTLAQTQRLDLVAAQQHVTLLEQNLGIARRYRWLGSIDVGVTSERDDDGVRLTGPNLSLQLPIFNQGQAGGVRAQAQLAQGQARLRALRTEVESSVRLGVERIAAQRAIAEEYRTALIPQRESIVARTQEKTNFNLVGAFELLLSKQQEVDTYEAYLEAVRDYWLAREELARAVGTQLPSDAHATDAVIDSKTILGESSTESPAATTPAGAIP